MLAARRERTRPAGHAEDGAARVGRRADDRRLRRRRRGGRRAARAARRRRPHRARERSRDRGRRRASDRTRSRRCRSSRRTATVDMVERIGPRRGGRASTACTCTSASRAPTRRCERLEAVLAVAAGRARALGELAVRRRRADRHALQPRAASSPSCRAAGAAGLRLAIDAYEAWVERLVALGVMEDTRASGGTCGRIRRSARSRCASPTSRRRSSGRHSSSGWCADLVADAPARERAAAATTSRTAGRRRARASTRSCCTRTASVPSPRVSSRGSCSARSRPSPRRSRSSPPTIRAADLVARTLV